MKKDLSIFIDPKTKIRLNLSIKEERNGEVISGELYNEKNAYPIIKGIPRFVDKSLYMNKLNNSKENQTIESFGTKWGQKRNQNLGSTKQDIKDLKEQFMATLGCSSESELKDLFKNTRRTLNAGCGVAWPEYLFNHNPDAERHCIDMSLSVEIAYKKTKKFKNVIVSQASIFEIPYPEETFDLIYSCGVIHHTPNPKRALQSLIKKLSLGGKIGIYIYCKKPFIRELVDREIRKISTKMSYDECMKFSREMTKLGGAFNKIKQPLIIEEDIELLNIKKGKYNLHKFIYDHFLKCWFNPKQDKEYADLVNQDWYHPYYASHHTKEEVAGWFEEAGIRKIECIQPKGWERSGFFISGRKI